VHISGIYFDNKNTLTAWADKIKSMGIKKVVLPFDAAQTNRETGLNLFDFFLARGFKVYKIKRLLVKIQAEHAHWLLSHATFDSSCVSGLRELGKFETWQDKHGLSQDIASAICYAGQYFRKADIKEMRMNKLLDEMQYGSRGGPTTDCYEMLGPYTFAEGS
jgi:hypothetical protein